jgi:glycine/D-amino acid oxidase-like deaminating enzyme
VSGLAKAVHEKGGCIHADIFVLYLHQDIFEKSKVKKVKQTNPTILKVNDCEMVASSVILATNAYTPQLGFLKNRVYPIQTAVLVTEKLTPNQLNALSWKDRDVIMEAFLIDGCTLQLTSDDRLFIRGTATYQY